MKERLKSKVVWLAVLAQILMIVTMFAPQIENEIKVVATSVIEILTLFGVLNNPTTHDQF